MISGRTLSTALQAVATGFADRALTLIAATDELDGQPELRTALAGAVVDNERPVDQAIRIGRVLSEAGADRSLVVDCYRCAFYLGADWPEGVPVGPYTLPEQSVEELRLARGELRRLRRELASTSELLHAQAAELEATRSQLNDSWRLVKHMRRSLSWRVTAPLRAPGRAR